MPHRAARLLLATAGLAAALAAPPPAAGGEADGDRARLVELLREYREVEKSVAWADVKKRRDLLAAMGRLESPLAGPILFEAFLEDRESYCRLPAMEALGRCGDPVAVKRLVAAALRDRNDAYAMALPAALAGRRDPELAAWLVKQHLGRGSPTVRAAVIESLGRMAAEVAFEPIREILADDPRDVRIACEALFALARIGGARAVPDLLPWLRHDDGAVREAAVLALAECGDPAVLPEIRPFAGDPAPQTREAVAAAIGRFRDEAGIPILIDLLKDERRRVVETARAVLEELTGAALGVDPDQWKAWWERRKAGEPPPPLPPPEDRTSAWYYGMRILSDRVLFMLDFSGSMKVGRPPRFETAKEELARALDGLPPGTLVNIVAFGGSPIWWRENETPLNPETLAKAKEFAANLSPGGGTNVYDTLEQALERNREIDTIYLIGDGTPSAGRVTGAEEIVVRIRHLNRLRKVRIHTIALLRGTVGGGPGAPDREEDEEYAAKFLAALAAATGGSFQRIE